MQRAQIQLLHAQVEFASRGNTSPASLIRAAKRVEPLDQGLARAAHLEALSAAAFASSLARVGGGAQEVANAVRAAGSAASPRNVADVLIDGWAALIADGCATAAPTLREALREFERPTVAADQLHLLWLVTLTAPIVLDDARWEKLSRLHVELARGTGALGELLPALNSRSYVHLFRGELEVAGALIEEAQVAIEATGATITPWGELLLAALRGDEQDTPTRLDAATADATQRGAGSSLTVIHWARALLCNGRCAYDTALAAARMATDSPANAAVAWGMVELIEAAARVGELEAAGEVARRFAEIAAAAGTDWALGVDARSRALLSTGATAEQLYREALRSSESSTSAHARSFERRCPTPAQPCSLRATGVKPARYAGAPVPAKTSVHAVQRTADPMAATDRDA